MNPQSPGPLQFPRLLDQVRAALPEDTPLYLVGGAVRDALLGRPTHDLDFTTPGDALQIAVLVGDRLGGAYFPLDEEHPTGRVVLRLEDQGRMLLDFARFRGPDLEADLRARDFTINAMAVDVRAPQQLIDPLKSVADLHHKVVRACSPQAFTQDPLRVVRAVRFATAFQLRILPETRALMRPAVPLLDQVSAERLRDELFRILAGRKPGSAIRALSYLGVLVSGLPELEALKGLKQPPPHIGDVWSHTLRTLERLEVLLEVLGPVHDPEAHADIVTGLASGKLGRYREQLSDHMATALTPDRPLRPLLFLAALYHDAGKANTREVDAQGDIRFHDHPRVSAELVARRARALHLSNQEIQRLTTVVRHHMRPLLLTQTRTAPTRRAIYRFFRDTGPAGVDICLLALADTLATYGPTLPQKRWEDQLSVTRALLAAWWEHHQHQVAPPPLLRGKDLIGALGMQPGPEIGYLLEALREAQACGQVQDRDQALQFARQWLVQRDQGKQPGQ